LLKNAPAAQDNQIKVQRMVGWAGHQLLNLQTALPKAV
jgi:hypothetical protein